jgi:hypothetical protein
VKQDQNYCQDNQDGDGNPVTADIREDNPDCHHCGYHARNDGESNLSMFVRLNHAISYSIMPMAAFAANELRCRWLMKGYFFSAVSVLASVPQQLEHSSIMFEPQAAIHFFICGPQEDIICSMHSGNDAAFSFACSA